MPGRARPSLVASRPNRRSRRARQRCDAVALERRIGPRSPSIPARAKKFLRAARRRPPRVPTPTPSAYLPRSPSAPGSVPAAAFDPDATRSPRRTSLCPRKGRPRGCTRFAPRTRRVHGTDTAQAGSLPEGPVYRAKPKSTPWLTRASRAGPARPGNASAPARSLRASAWARASRPLGVGGAETAQNASPLRHPTPQCRRRVRTTKRLQCAPRSAHAALRVVFTKTYSRTRSHVMES